MRVGPMLLAVPRYIGQRCLCVILRAVASPQIFHRPALPVCPAIARTWLDVCTEIGPATSCVYECVSVPLLHCTVSVPPWHCTIRVASAKWSQSHVRQLVHAGAALSRQLPSSPHSTLLEPCAYTVAATKRSSPPAHALLWPLKADAGAVRAARAAGLPRRAAAQVPTPRRHAAPRDQGGRHQVVPDEVRGRRAEQGARVLGGAESWR
jgi:hypothetical protein